MTTEESDMSPEKMRSSAAAAVVIIIMVLGIAALAFSMGAEVIDGQDTGLEVIPSEETTEDTPVENPPEE